jgi:hypothetical protein
VLTREARSLPHRRTVIPLRVSQIPITDGRKRNLGPEDTDLGRGIRPKHIGARVKRIEDRRLLTGEGARARTEGRLFGSGVATYAELTGIGSGISAAPGMPINTGTETATIRLDSTDAATGSFGVAAHGLRRLTLPARPDLGR